MAFQGGPLAGQEVTPESLAQAEQGGLVDVAGLAAGLPSQQADADSRPGSGDLSESDLIGRILGDLLDLAGRSETTHQSKLKAQKAMTLLQEIQAAEEREGEQALAGRPSPRLLGKLYAGQGAGG